MSTVASLCDLGTDNKNYLFFIWLPLGVALAIFRICCLLILAAVAIPIKPSMRRPLFRLLLFIFGIKLTCNMPVEKVKAHTQGCVVAANHISTFDFISILIMPLSTVMIVKVSSQIKFLIGYLFFLISGARYWRVANARSLGRYFKEWRKNRNTTALYCTPEGTINNGTGLFRFRPEFLSRGFPVVPLAVRLRLPFGISAHPLHIRGTLRFLRLLTMPYLVFELFYLAQRVPIAGQSKQAFADEIQMAIANHLRIPATTFTAEDKRHFVLGLR